MSSSLFPDLSRVAFFDGERLAAADLNAAATVQRELRWLHNRSLHSWGIALGFAVSGATGDQQVVIGPGYGVDCLGREVILTESITRVVPSRADNGQGKPVTYFLVAAYPGDSALPVLEERQGECGTAGPVRLQERANIYWKAQGEPALLTGFELVLAQAQVLNCQLASPLAVDQRRSARPAQQPFIASGATDVGGTAWQLMKGTVGTEVIMGLQVQVDTTQARFSTAPVYQATLSGTRYIRNQPVGNFPVYLIDGSCFVSDSARNTFMFNVLMPRDLTGFAPGTATTPPLTINPGPIFDADGATLLELATNNWWVEWVGVEG
ncbi:MAG TPA: hypothetical protein VGJ60_13650 [Chloroflexota bacterium]